jgi:hypothetical protein
VYHPTGHSLAAHGPRVSVRSHPAAARRPQTGSRASADRVWKWALAGPTGPPNGVEPVDPFERTALCQSGRGSCRLVAPGPGDRPERKDGDRAASSASR